MNFVPNSSSGVHFFCYNSKKLLDFKYWIPKYVNFVYELIINYLARPTFESNDSKINSNPLNFLWSSGSTSKTWWGRGGGFVSISLIRIYLRVAAGGAMGRSARLLNICTRYSTCMMRRDTKIVSIFCIYDRIVVDVTLNNTCDVVFDVRTYVSGCISTETTSISGRRARAFHHVARRYGNDTISSARYVHTFKKNSFFLLSYDYYGRRN